MIEEGTLGLDQMTEVDTLMPELMTEGGSLGSDQITEGDTLMPD